MLGRVHKSVRCAFNGSRRKWLSFDGGNFRTFSPSRTNLLILARARCCLTRFQTAVPYLCHLNYSFTLKNKTPTAKRRRRLNRICYYALFEVEVTFIAYLADPWESVVLKPRASKDAKTNNTVSSQG